MFKINSISNKKKKIVYLQIQTPLSSNKDCFVIDLKKYKIKTLFQIIGFREEVPGSVIVPETFFSSLSKGKLKITISAPKKRNNYKRIYQIIGGM